MLCSHSRKMAFPNIPSGAECFFSGSCLHIEFFKINLSQSHLRDKLENYSIDTNICVYVNKIAVLLSYVYKNPTLNCHSLRSLTLCVRFQHSKALTDWKRKQIP